MSLKDTLQGPVASADADLPQRADSCTAAQEIAVGGPPAFAHAEAVVCEKMAVQRRRLAVWRKNGALQKGVDWDFVGGVVHLSDAGVEKAAGLLSGALAEPVVLAVKMDRAELVDVRVTGHSTNPMLIVAEAADGRRWLVRVRQNRVFVPGMVLAVRLVEPGFAVYEGVAPRWPKDPQFWRHFPEA